ncbi:COG1470 family protein [Parasedimentitalea psychrophila]|uniref:Uncharacterized protein n=1 Tax=Parasedimentitalea psychrophila TaxID=2997337 RepID=A0A9Y2KW53_9RHOB|nr:hypothetical protein [Parasedimentitalea psychrophila]WIY23633.1 hypothetical protein QPJ95_13320 [Parasedimentitalea psychrophila]
MPYFERKLWQKQIDKITEVDTEIVDDNVDMEKIALSILSTEAGPQHALGGRFRCRKLVQPGESGVIVLSIAANDDGGPVTLDLSPGDLQSRSGCAISANLIQLKPAQLTIPPGGSQRLEVHVQIPHSTKPGVYSGRVTGNNPDSVIFIVEYEVNQNS